jgi:LL-diaminopimelate aminotransferase
LTDVAAAHARGKSRGALVMYVNLPHNPTGMAYTKADWEELIAWAIEYRVTLVVDEAYIDLCYRDDIVSVLQVPGWERCCIVLQSVSKGWNATGLRFGWIVAHPTVIKAMRKVMDVKDSGMFGPSIVAGLWCLKHPTITYDTRDKYFRLHLALADGLQKAGLTGRVPDAGLCQFVPAPKSVKVGHLGFDDVLKPFKDAADCAKWLREELRISVMHAEAAGGQWLRWAVTLQPVPECGLPTEESVIDEAVRRLKSFKFKF